MRTEFPDGYSQKWQESEEPFVPATLRRTPDAVLPGSFPMRIHAHRVLFATGKRAFDVLFSLTSLLLLTPLLLVVAIAIKATTRGPVLYKQKRFGRNGTSFDILKFRTMYAERCDRTASLQTVPNDARVTPLGRFLRRHNIDEYPQLMNVLKGEMSIVGPRPHAVGMKVGGALYSDLVPDHSLRLSVKPGITGLAQVNGCAGPVGEVAQALQRHEWDVRYVERRGFLLDIAIVARTVLHHFRLSAPGGAAPSPLASSAAAPATD